MTQNKNTASTKQSKADKQRNKERERQWQLDLKAVMQTEPGRRVIYNIINDLCHVDASSAQHSGSWTYFAEGERNIGRELKIAIYEAAFDDWQKMEREHVMDYIDNKLNEETDNE